MSKKKIERMRAEAARLEQEAARLEEKEREKKDEGAGAGLIFLAVVGALIYFFFWPSADQVTETEATPLPSASTQTQEQNNEVEEETAAIVETKAESPALLPVPKPLTDEEKLEKAIATYAPIDAPDVEAKCEDEFRTAMAISTVRSIGGSKSLAQARALEAAKYMSIEAIERHMRVYFFISDLNRTREISKSTCMERETGLKPEVEEQPQESRIQMRPRAEIPTYADADIQEFKRLCSVYEVKSDQQIKSDDAGNFLRLQIVEVFLAWKEAPLYAGISTLKAKSKEYAARYGADLVEVYLTPFGGKPHTADWETYGAMMYLPDEDRFVAYDRKWNFFPHSADWYIETETKWYPINQIEPVDYCD